MKIGLTVETRARKDRRFPGEMAALTLIWATLEQDRMTWRDVRMDADILPAVAAAKRSYRQNWTCPFLTRTWRRRNMPPDSGFKWVAPSLNFHHLLGRDGGAL